MSTIVNLYIGGTPESSQVYTADLVLTAPYTEPAGNLLVLRSRPDIDPATATWAVTLDGVSSSFPGVTAVYFTGTLAPTLATVTASFTGDSSGYEATWSSTLADVSASFSADVPQAANFYATLDGLTADFPGAQVYDVGGAFDGTLETVYSIFTTQFINSYCDFEMELPEPVLSAWSGLTGAVELSAPELLSTGNDDDNARVHLTLPALDISSYSGASGANELDLSLSSAGTVQGLITAAIEIDAPVLTAAGRVGAVSASILTLDDGFVATGFGGGYASLDLLAPELTSAGQSQALITVDLTLPFLELTSTGSSGATATISLDLPELVLVSSGLTGSIATSTLTLPALILTSSDALVNWETTYAVNLSTGAVTQLQLGRFEKLVTAHGRLYGLRDGELFSLTGEDDDGQAIPATIRFAPQTFGVTQAKRMSDVYLTSCEDDGLTLTLIQDETTSWTYQTATDTAPALGTHKVKVGRGVTFHSVGLIVQNRQGGKLDMGGMELLVQPLSRRPR